MKCINCGYEHSGKFCPKCGTKTEKQCTKCGNIHSGKFCPKCGTYVLNNHSQQPVNRPVPPAPRPVAEPTKEKGSKVLVIIICILSVIVVAGICGLALYFSGVLTDDGNEAEYSETVKKETASEEKTEEKKKDSEEEEPEETEDAEEIEEETQEAEFSLNYDADEYLYPSDEQNITKEELDQLSREEVALVRNEIYARHGYTFSTQSYTDFFNTKSWYNPNPYLTDGAYIEDSLNFYEKTNKDYIVEYEKEMGWR